MDVPDWDLLAVVRGCTAKEPTIPKVTVETTVSTTDVQTERRFQSESCGLFGFQTQKSEDLQDLCRPFCTADGFQSLYSSSCATAPVSAARSAVSAALQGGFVAEQAVFLGQQQQVHPHQGQVIFGASSSCSGARSSQTQKSKKRKNLMKKVCHVPAEGSSSDMWSWRKYGQKPIKGSPYPRGYYRCSSSKGCLARKQVERDKSDPKMFIVTYTSDHNHPMPTHRNSLAGSTRQKPTTAATATATTSSTSTTTDNPTSSSPTASLSPLTDSKTEEDTEMGLSELMKNDDFFVGFEELDGSDPGDCFSDQFSPPEIDFPWLTSTSATASTATAAGGSC